MEMIGRSACRGQWNNELSVACYRAAEQLRVTLQPVEAEVLEELYSRITTSRDEDNVRAVMDTWASLQQYRKQWLAKQLRHTGTHMLTHKEVTEVTDSYKWDVIWYELTEQQKGKKWQSTANAILHKTNGWGLTSACPQTSRSSTFFGTTEHAHGTASEPRRVV